MPVQPTERGLDELELTSQYIMALAAAKLDSTCHVRAPDRFSVERILGCYRAADACVDAMVKAGEWHCRQEKSDGKLCFSRSNG
jgi:hypothetical protein